MTKKGKTDEELFDEIIQRAIGEANRIRCSPDEYVSNLKSWIEDVRVAIQAMEESIARRHRP